MRLFLLILANSTKLCYTYDKLSRVTSRIEKTLSGTVLHTERFTYDLAGNVTAEADESSFTYDAQNRLVSYQGKEVTYDLDGNMVDDGQTAYVYDSANRLIAAGETKYTYNAEDVRIRNFCEGEETTYVYNTNCRLSQLLVKSTNGVITKYVYGRGLIGEEVNGEFKTYHFDFRGSTVAITNGSGNVTDTFAYDTYGKCVSRTGTTPVIFGYNGRDGVVTDNNGLIYMRARYYSPEMRRFINADIVAGNISNAITLNRYAYANGNPVSNIDPFGLSVDNREAVADAFLEGFDNVWDKILGAVGIFSQKAADKINNIYKQVVTFISKIDFTYSTGIAINFSMAHTCFAFQGGLSFDDDGDVALQGSWGYGFTTSNGIGLSIVQYKTVTNAPHIDKLNGPGFSIGGSITVPVEGVPLTAGGDVNIIPDLDKGKTYYGGTVSTGIATPSGTGVSVEGHITETHTATVEKSKFNLFDTVKSIWNKIKGA